MDRIDLELITLAGDGDPQAMTALLEHCHKPLFGYFLRATRNVHDAEDLLGEMTAKLLVSLKRYDDRGKFENWLFRIAANLLRDRGRKLKRRGVPLSLAGDGDENPIDPPAEAEPIENSIVRAEQRLALREALAQLDETTRELVVGRYFGFKSFRELAEDHGCPLGTVLARVHRGVKKLRGFLDDIK